MAVGNRPRGGHELACPDAERLATYAEGVLDAAGRDDVERHLLVCNDCREVLSETMAFVHVESQHGRVIPFRARRWMAGVAAALATAAALALVVRIVRPEWLRPGPGTDRPELIELVAALATEPTRPVEGRLTGGFAYAPPPSPTRGPGDREVSPDVRIAAANIEKAVQKNPDDRNAQAAAAIAHLVLKEWDAAIGALETSNRVAPDRASSYSDLSAAYLGRAAARGGSRDAELALAAADRALAIVSNLREALFNRALALDALGRTEEARAAWNLYLAAETDPRWQAEARSRLESRSSPGR